MEKNTVKSKEGFKPFKDKEEHEEALHILLNMLPKDKKSFLLAYLWRLQATLRGTAKEDS